MAAAGAIPVQGVAVVAVAKEEDSNNIRLSRSNLDLRRVVPSISNRGKSRPGREEVGGARCVETRMFRISYVRDR